MPAKQTYFQMSFEGGMVERPTQDHDYTDNQLKYKVPQSRTALYIENWDPTIVPRALTKRKGMALARETPWTIEAGLVEIIGQPSGFDINAPIQCDLERFTLLIDIDPDPLMIDATEKSTILGMMNVDYNKPSPQSIPLAFIREVDTTSDNKQKTVLVGYYRNDFSQTKTWRNPHIAGDTGATGSIRTGAIAADYPGWEILGTLSDATRHGGTVILTTNIAAELWPVAQDGSFDWSTPWSEDMYPCYVWTYWDLRRVRSGNKFWNIIGDGVGATILSDLTDNYSGDDKYSLFKVLTPSMYATRNDIISFKYYGASPLYDCDISSTGTLRTNLPGLVEDVPTTAIEIGILEVECRVFDPNVVIKTFNANMPESEDRLPVLVEWPYLNPDIGYLNSIETLKVSNLDPFGETGKYKRALVSSKSEIVIKSSDTSDYDWQKHRGRFTDEVNNQRTVDVVKADKYIGSSDFDFNAEYWTGIVGVSLPDYVTNKNPRYWIQGEKIPILVTLKIRGAEVIAGSYTHEIQRWNTYPNFALFSGQRFVKSVPPSYLNGTIPMLAAVQKKLVQNLVDKVPQLDGTPITQPAVTFWYYNTTGAESTSDYFPAAYNNLYDYYWEPFNPTAAFPFVANDLDNYAQDVYYRPMGFTSPPDNWDGDASGYRRHHAEGPFLYFTVKIKADQIGSLLEMGLDAINIYVAESGTESIMRSKGNRVVEDPDPGIYQYPATIDLEDYGKYRLVKTVLVNGEGAPFADATDTTKWKESYTYGMVVPTNSWMELSDHIIATGQDENGDATTILTPDFALPDYPAISPRLSLNSSGQYWQGRGASVVASIKGRTFLSGCVDEYGEEEQGIIRYSDVQSGVITLDIFSKEGFIKLGGNPHTALVEFREQLWTFSRREVYRMQMPSITDTSTWEYLDKYPGQGTYSPKTVIATPLGVFWCNESGVWSSDGRIPENIADPVLTIYQAMATNQPQYYAQKIDLPMFPYTDQGINPYLELSYDEENNELVITSPTMTGTGTGDNGNNPDQQSPNTEFRLVFHFSSRTWRVETWDQPTFNTPLNEFDDRGEVTF